MNKQERFNEQVDRFIDDQEEFNEPVDPWLDRIAGHLTYSKNRASKIQASREPATIAMVMGFTLLRVLSTADLARMCRGPDAGDIPLKELISFARAHLVVEVSDDEGNRLLIAVECSHIADRRDTDRATRNADYLTRFTGEPARAAVASARNNQEIQSLIDDGTVWWYQLEDDTDGVEEAPQVLAQRQIRRAPSALRMERRPCPGRAGILSRL